ncbi:MULTISPECIES: carboxymuconolactone decarboxylase family protein [Pseudomonadota]|jgi:alkylhydroperoxidase family enzyme|uniref:carboxymuconolactone decarboxylase family protein n=1 Tax=Pseudomonadota TaxID=1224 RepID=UPI00076A94D7|nr:MULTISPECIES: carboxymuconolactone decarboxylase family protein [Pseudomonadota]MAF60126.1 carboxymuconolactone decarboxylase family protein [Blastomonas sp.]MBA4778539.1 carboxymuconolactone decarboxylase family protein [Blastomonas sp.]
MPRLRQVPRDEADDYVRKLYTALFGDRDPVDQPGTATGTPGNWWTVFALVPDAFRHTTEGFGFYRSDKRKLDPVLRELGQTRAGYAVGSRFVYSQHMKAARFAGLSEEQVQAIAHWQVADCFTPVQRAVLAYADALVLQHGRVPDGVFAALKAELSDEEILELTYVTATYIMHAVMSRALRLEYDDVDDPVTEVPAPEGATADVMGMVDRRKRD